MFYMDTCKLTDETKHHKCRIQQTDISNDAHMYLLATEKELTTQ